MAIGERLHMARKMSGQSQRALAQAAGVSAMAISKYERDQVVPSSGVLIRLARVLNVKVEFFMRPVTVSLSEPAFRCRKKLGVKQQESVAAQTQEWLERYLELEGLFDGSLGFEIPQVSRQINSVEDAERVAEQLRGAWNIGMDPIDNLIELLESKGIKVDEVEAPDSFDALTFWVNGTTPVIAIRLDLPGDRQRFNLAHELGHLLLEPAEEVDEEKAAHRFAAAFLVPAEAAYNELGVHRTALDFYELYLLKQKYGMSMAAWVYRAQDLNIVTESAARRLWQAFSQRGWRSQEPWEPVPPEKTMRMKRLALRALAEDVISRSRAAELLGEPLSEI